MPQTAESEALEQAVKLFGSVVALSQWLKVPSETLTDWITGNGVPPNEVLLQVSNLVQKASPPPSSGASPLAGAGVRVLIVAAERDTLMTLGILLRSEGCEVRLSGGAEAPKAVRDFRPHAVLVDLGMPNRGGYQAATELTREYAAARPLLIAVAAQGGSEEQATEACGFHHYLSRPYNPERLLRILAALKKS